MKVVTLTPFWAEELAARLHEGITLVAVDKADRAALERDLPGAQILVTTQFDHALAPLCTSLELIICPAAGTEGIDRDVLPPGVEVKNGIGHEIPIAEYVIGALVALYQRFHAADAALRRNVWQFGFFGSRAMVGELYGSNLGLVGFGRIGFEVARRASAFGMRRSAVTLHPDKPVEPGVVDAKPGDLARAEDVDALVSTADALVIACELSPLTHGLIDARRLRLMKPAAVIVNVARGPIVDEGALFEALQSKRLGGAAIDVWYSYPELGSSVQAPSRFPFGELENVLMTPHQSAWTPGTKERRLEFFARTINDHAMER